MHFELSSEPLRQALLVFGRQAGLVVLAPSELLEGRKSTPIDGDYSPREALQRLLAGTGLQASFSGEDDVLIVPQPAMSPSPQPASSSLPLEAGPIPTSAIDGLQDRDASRAYVASVQAKLTQALCASEQTRPGNYRLIAQLRIGDGGTVVASDVVVSTGVAARDAAIEQTIRSLVFDSAPPAGLPEPVTILLRPVNNDVHLVCPSAPERD
jgi:hypothetical protein